MHTPSLRQILLMHRAFHRVPEVPRPRHQLTHTEKEPVIHDESVYSTF